MDRYRLRCFIPIILVLCLVSLAANFLVEALVIPGGTEHISGWITDVDSPDSAEVEEEDGDEHFILSDFCSSHVTDAFTNAHFLTSQNYQHWVTSPLLPPPKF